MSRSGPKKIYEFHFRAGESDGERFLVLVDRMGMPKSDVARDAILLYLTIAESAPPELARHKLAAFIEDAFSCLAQARILTSAPARNGHAPPSPTIARADRPRPARKAHKP